MENAKRKRCDREQTLQRVMLETPESSPSPELTKQRGRKQIRMDRSALYRQNVKLQEKIKQMKSTKKRKTINDTQLISTWYYPTP